jgi:heat-inducible transcriptional repressor
VRGHAGLESITCKMPSDPNIGKREREVLTAIVETFISTGEPVGSRTLSRSNREGLSPATHSQRDGGFVRRGISGAAAHLAGRIPTTEAYRYYVEQISGNRQARAPGREHDF